MTKAVGDDESMFKSLQEVVQLFEMAQTSVFKLMSSVSPFSSDNSLVNHSSLMRIRTLFQSSYVIRNMRLSCRSMTST